MDARSQTPVAKDRTHTRKPMSNINANTNASASATATASSPFFKSNFTEARNIVLQVDGLDDLHSRKVSRRALFMAKLHALFYSWRVLFFWRGKEDLAHAIRNAVWFLMPILLTFAELIVNPRSHARTRTHTHAHARARNLMNMLPVVGEPAPHS